MRSRVQRIFEKVAADEKLPDAVDAIAFTNGVEPNLDLSFFYVTDLVSGGIFERCNAIIRPDGSTLILTNSLEEESARKAPEAKVETYTSAKHRDELLSKELKDCARIGINAAEATHENIMKLQKLAPKAEWVDVSLPIQKARLVKDAVELDRLRKACDIASRVAEDIPSLLRDGVKEFESAAEVNYRMQKLGASGPSFSTITAFGETSSEPHYSPGDRALRKGSYALFDFGAYYKHYASDITRTFFYGTPKDKHREVYETVQRAQELAFEAVKPGERADAVDAAAREFIDMSEYKGRFIHGTGHTIGLSVHDGGGVSHGSEMILEPGCVFTIEPGIYIPGFGGVRIEDDVLVTPRGYEILTTAPREFHVVG